MAGKGSGKRNKNKDYRIEIIKHRILESEMKILEEELEIKRIEDQLHIIDIGDKHSDYELIESAANTVPQGYQSPIKNYEEFLSNRLNDMLAHKAADTLNLKFWKDQRKQYYFDKYLKRNKKKHIEAIKEAEQFPKEI